MKSLSFRITKALPMGTVIKTCDNSGARLIRIFSVVGAKTVKGRIPAAGVSDLVFASVKRGSPEMKKQKVYAVIVRQRKEYKRPDGTRLKFEDNSAVVLKDEKSGSPKGTIIKGPVAKEVCDRWPGIAKIANIVV
ncbi:50S ribosomal protein L14 [Candidatus Woesearchaeota archaeon]|nr:50S ribosomal protein L14 [Candidatus Woesearchaeota archaeon]|tara:strand:+ start:7767 stop:8171 length:405 start_codon:yes stop_codon:yes gene_type:complete